MYVIDILLLNRPINPYDKNANKKVIKSIYINLIKDY